MTATLQLTAGFYLARDVLYLSTDSSVSDIAALESATYAPNLATAPAASNDDPARSAREPVLLVPTGPWASTTRSVRASSPPWRASTMDNAIALLRSRLSKLPRSAGGTAVTEWDRAAARACAASAGT